jgi:hypothetical protein
MIYAVEMISCGMKYLLRFMKIGIGFQAILRFCLSNLRGCNAAIADQRDLCAVDIASCGMTYIPSFMKIGTSVQGILRFDVRNLEGCIVDITNGRDL